jgi:ABC-type transport system involved in cytochrome c biogenesis, permease component
MVLPADCEQKRDLKKLYLFISLQLSFLKLIIYLRRVSGFIYLSGEQKISVIFINSAISKGLVFTALVYLTWSIWGKPTWGTYWVWDARITSTFILFIQYIGLLALRSSFSSHQTADQIVSILAIIGAINIPIIKFSVDWWNTLHQGASITTSGSSIDSEMLYALPIMLIALLFISFAIFGRNIQFEILNRSSNTKMIKEVLNG